MRGQWHVLSCLGLSPEEVKPPRSVLELRPRPPGCQRPTAHVPPHPPCRDWLSVSFVGRITNKYWTYYTGLQTYIRTYVHATTHNFHLFHGIVVVPHRPFFPCWGSWFHVPCSMDATNSYEFLIGLGALHSPLLHWAGLPFAVSAFCSISIGFVAPGR